MNLGKDLFFIVHGRSELRWDLARQEVRNMFQVYAQNFLQSLWKTIEVPEEFPALAFDGTDFFVMYETDDYFLNRRSIVKWLPLSVFNKNEPKTKVQLFEERMKKEGLSVDKEPDGTYSDPEVYWKFQNENIVDNPV